MGGGHAQSIGISVAVCVIVAACGSAPASQTAAPDSSPAPASAPLATSESAKPVTAVTATTAAPIDTTPAAALPTEKAAAVIDTLKSMQIDGVGFDLTDCPAGTAADWNAVAPGMFIWDGSTPLAMDFVSAGDGGIHCNLGTPDVFAGDGEQFAAMEIDSVDTRQLAILDNAAAENSATPFLGGQLLTQPGLAVWYDNHLEILLHQGAHGQFDPLTAIQALVPVVATHLAAADPATLPKPES